MRISTKLYKQIEDNRGQINRNKFIINIIEEHFKGQNGGLIK